MKNIISSSAVQKDAQFAALHAKIRKLENAGPKANDAHLPFGLPDIDTHLPSGGLGLGGLHEIGSAAGFQNETAATDFTAGILARTSGPIVWITRQKDLFAPALAEVGLNPSRILFGDLGNDKDLLIAMEEALHYPQLAAVVGEVSSLSIVASRRLHLAARTSGVTAIALYRLPRFGQKEKKEPTASLTRWRISVLDSDYAPAGSIGRPNWHVELTRCRDAQPASWKVGACDEKGYLGLPADLAHRPAASWERHALA